MNVSHPKVLGISLASGIIAAAVVGGLFVIVGDWDFMYAWGTVLLVLGLMALALGLLGATEPPDGWATGRGPNRRQAGRRSFLAQVTHQAPGVEKTGSLSLAVWGVAVGGGLIVAGLAAFSLT